MTRGKLARLEALEEAHVARLAEVQAENWAHLQAAESRLSATDRAAWKDSLAVLEQGQDPECLDRMRQACAHLPAALPVDHPAKEAAERWADRALNVPEGAPLLSPPAERVAEFLAYFEACAAYCDAVAVQLPLSPDVQRLARWGAALWRFEAALCRVLGRAGGHAVSA